MDYRSIAQELDDVPGLQSLPRANFKVSAAAPKDLSLRARRQRRSRHECVGIDFHGSTAIHRFRSSHADVNRGRGTDWQKIRQGIASHRRSDRLLSESRLIRPRHAQRRERLALGHPEDTVKGYEVIKTLYEQKIYPSAEGVRNTIRRLGASNEKSR